MPPLDPCHLAPVASINRVRLGAVTARDLLSAPALEDLAREAGLRPDGPVRSYLDHRLAGADVAGEAVARRYGERLARLLGTLRSGERAARPEWDESWWARWAATTTVWLGGGLAGGAFGARVAAVAGALLGPACRVAVPPEPGDLPLLGAARIALRDPGPALVLDFGHTLVKRAVASGPSVLRGMAPVPAPDEAADGPAVAASMSRTLAAAWVEAGRPGRVVAAIAAYTPDGTPVRTQLGTYARLADVSADVPGLLSAGLGVPVALVHDGTAAAHALPPDPHSAVVLLGTSLGVGYPHPCPG